MIKYILSVVFSIISISTIYAQYDLVSPFRDFGVEGSITIYDLKANKWITNDLIMSQSGTLPASTFKIVNTLIALECGVIKDGNEIIKWPGVCDTLRYGNRTDIFHDLSIKEAFKKSAVWTYLEIAKSVGKERYKKYLSILKYGNQDISVEDIDFWNFGNLAISPANQIEILIELYNETLPFKKQNIKTVKQLLLDEETSEYKISAKTGFTNFKDKSIGWWVGYIENKENVYFFATRIFKTSDLTNPDFGRSRKEITKVIFKQMGIIQ